MYKPVLKFQDLVLLAVHSWHGSHLQQKKHFLLEVYSGLHELFDMSRLIGIQAYMFAYHPNNSSQFHKKDHCINFCSTQTGEIYVRTYSS